MAELIALQNELRGKVILAGDLSGVDLVGGADTSSDFALYGRPAVADRELAADRGGSAVDGSNIYAAIVVWSRSLGKVVAKATAVVPATFPYVPGLLAFREMPALIAAWDKLELKPEAIIVDGQGIAHPRRCGIACHLGLAVGLPTVGCGKTRLIGRYEEPGIDKGEWAELIDDNVGTHLKPKAQRLRSEIIGRVVRTRKGVLPVFVSPGHLCDIDGATRLLLACCTQYRLPEPIREAHRAAGEARRNSKTLRRDCV